MSAKIQDRVEDFEAYKKRAAVQEMNENKTKKWDVSHSVPPNSPESEDIEYWDHFSGIFFQLFPSLENSGEFRPRLCGVSSNDVLREQDWRISREELKKTKPQNGDSVAPWAVDRTQSEEPKSLKKDRLFTMRRNLTSPLVLPKKPSSPFKNKVNFTNERHFTNDSSENFTTASSEKLFEINRKDEIRENGKVHLPFTNDNTCSVWYGKTKFQRQIEQARAPKINSNTIESKINIETAALPNVNEVQDCLTASASKLNPKEVKHNTYNPNAFGFENQKLLVNVVRKREPGRDVMNSVEREKSFTVRKKAIGKELQSNSTTRLESILVKRAKSVEAIKHVVKKVSFTDVELHNRGGNNSRRDLSKYGVSLTGRMNTQNFEFPLVAKRESFSRFRPRHKILTNEPISMDGKITYELNDYNIWSRTKKRKELE